MNLISKYFPNRHLVCKYFTKLAKFIYSLHKGKCVGCIDCCRVEIEPNDDIIIVVLLCRAYVYRMYRSIMS